MTWVRCRRIRIRRIRQEVPSRGRLRPQMAEQVRRIRTARVAAVCPTMSSRRILDISPDVLTPGVVDEAARLLRDRQLVVAPTETRYGLLARADSPAAVDRLCQAKMRGERHPVAVFASSAEEIGRLAVLSEDATRLSRRFLPGPLTLVLTARVDWPAPLVINGKIGVRWSSSPVIGALLTATGTPLTATSANLSGQGERERVEDVAQDFGEAVALYLNGGPLTGATSTVVDCTADHIRVLREAAIEAAALEAALKG
ncbi:threonylcarbamoyl-AMP synthase [candidate division GN15 bacterium]|nr:threonylcarbamoyl-AMP synthase [candidate division GN15 bacterium]